jgi:hypothetical protein
MANTKFLLDYDLDYDQMYANYHLYKFLPDDLHNMPDRKTNHLYL